MARSLIPRSFFSNYPNVRLPSFFEEFENELSSINDQPYHVGHSEDQHNVYIDIPLPGLQKENIEITLDKGFIWVKGERKKEEKDKDRKYHREITSHFNYRVSIPGQIDESKEPIANFKDGILTLTFPKAQQNQSKKLSIQ